MFTAIIAAQMIAQVHNDLAYYERFGCLPPTIHLPKEKPKQCSSWLPFLFGWLIGGG